MKYIYVTASVVGKTWQYELLGRRGHRRLLPTYHAELGDECDPSTRIYFAVTRDSALVVFGKRMRRYTKGGECPPHYPCKPYRGRIRYAKRNGWCLALYEQGFYRRDGTPDWSTLQGTGKLKRRHTLIHAGPASGFGCLSVAGGRRGFARFKKALTRILSEGEEIIVFVEPRPQAHHDIHLTR